MEKDVRQCRSNFIMKPRQHSFLEEFFNVFFTEENLNLSAKTSYQALFGKRIFHVLK